MVMFHTDVHLNEKPSCQIKLEMTIWNTLHYFQQLISSKKFQAVFGANEFLIIYIDATKTWMCLVLKNEIIYSLLFCKILPTFMQKSIVDVFFSCDTYNAMSSHFTVIFKSSYLTLNITTKSTFENIQLVM